jgi:hypothetical protein
MGDKKSLYIKVVLIVVAIGVTYFLAAVVMPNVLVTLTKAAPATVISTNDSRVLGEKILAKADGIDKCVVNVFILDKDGKGVSGKNVSMEGVDGITAVKPVTDNDGKSVFSITSKIEGQFTLSALVEGTPLPREIKVTFRN